MNTNLIAVLDQSSGTVIIRALLRGEDGEAAIERLFPDSYIVNDANWMAGKLTLDISTAR